MRQTSSMHSNEYVRVVACLKRFVTSDELIGTLSNDDKDDEAVNVNKKYVPYVKCARTVKEFKLEWTGLIPRKITEKLSLNALVVHKN